MLKYIIALILPLTSCWGQSPTAHLIDFILYVPNERYNITEYTGSHNIVQILMYDNYHDRYQAFICCTKDPWVFPKFYPEEVAEKSMRMTYKGAMAIFETQIPEDLYGF